MLLLAAIGVVVVVAAAAVLLRQSSGKRQSAAGHRPVSAELVGAMFDGPVLGPRVNLGRQLDAAVGSGVESLRVAVRWSSLQPYRTASEVPSADRSQFETMDGVPTRFAGLDQIVGAAAARGVSVMPVVESTPGWDAQRPGDPASPPRATAPYAAFLTVLAHRYGPQGTFWATHPALARVPIRMWQIWNEPNFVRYWSVQPFAPAYVALLEASRAALKAADPGAKVVLAGFADFSWEYLADIYRALGARRPFDVVAIHPYTARPSGVIEILQRARAVMNRFGDRLKPLLATEITWPSSEGEAPPQFGVSTTEAQQAQRLGQLMPLLGSDRKQLGLMGFYWYTWMGDESPRAAPYAFDYAGLLKYVNGSVSAKPALSVFKRWALTIEGCRRKTRADVCAG
jgi:hypothetical protein